MGKGDLDILTHQVHRLVERFARHALAQQVEQAAV